MLEDFFVWRNNLFIYLFLFGLCETMQSMSGHTSPVESIAFDSAEVLVLAGASNGVIKLWDLEEVKSELFPDWFLFFG